LNNPLYIKHYPRGTKRHHLPVKITDQARGGRYGSIPGGDEVSLCNVEGIDYDFSPDVPDNTPIHRHIKTNGWNSFLMGRRIIREVGLLIGGSFSQ